MVATIDMPVEIEDSLGYKAVSWKVTWDNIEVISALFGGQLVANSHTAYKAYAVILNFPDIPDLRRHVSIGDYVVWREEAGFGIMSPVEHALYYR